MTHRNKIDFTTTACKTAFKTSKAFAFIQNEDFIETYGIPVSQHEHSTLINALSTGIMCLLCCSSHNITVDLISIFVKKKVKTYIDITR